MESYDIAWYFEEGAKKSAVLLDDANFCKDTFPLFDPLKKEINQALSENEKLGYTYPGGNKELIALISEHESYKENITLTPENIVVHSGGCTGAIDNIFRTLFRLSTKVDILFPIPTYPEIVRSALYNQLNVVPVKTKREYGFQPTFEEIKAALTPAILAIFILSPGNPTSLYINQEDLAKIKKLCKEKGIYLIVDSIFEEATLQFQRQNIFKEVNPGDKIIKIKGFSKDRPQLNDLRLSWTVSTDKEMNKKLIEVERVSKYSASKLAQRIALVDLKYRILQDKKEASLILSLEEEKSLNEYHSHVVNFQTTITQALVQTKNLISKNSSVKDFILPDAGNLIFIQANENQKIKNSHELFFYILDKANIAISPGHLFLTEKNELWFRITMAKNPHLFLESVQNILNSLNQLQKETK